MTRSEQEEPSDFQNYTLVSLVGVAVHLAGAAPAEPSLLGTLVRAPRFQTSFLCFGKHCSAVCSCKPAASKPAPSSGTVASCLQCVALNWV